MVGGGAVGAVGAQVAHQSTASRGFLHPNRLACVCGRVYSCKSTVTLRFSPRFGSVRVARALANSFAATALLEGPSQSSAMAGSTTRTHASGSFGPPGHHTTSFLRHVTARS